MKNTKSLTPTSDKQTEAKAEVLKLGSYDTRTEVEKLR